MGRLIDADILIAELKESDLHHCNNPREDSLLQRDRVIVRAQPTVEAIPKAEYEARLKADMVAILDRIRAEIEEHCGLAKENHCRYCSYCNNLMGVREILEIIDKHKAETENT
jgi:hypothetical protein